MSKHLLHFAIGPVQGFIGQARRTRDLWAGSFLLSCLAGMAMRAVEDAGGKVLFPCIDHDPLYAVLHWDASGAKGRPVRSGSGPVVGSLPNRFKAEVDETFDPNTAASRVRAYWGHLSETVRNQILVTANPESWAVWERQIDAFFEINWVKGPADLGQDGAWLDRRKNWRSHAPSAEPGDHCMLIGELQELSGFVQARGEVQQQLAFWAAMSEAIESYLSKGDRDRVFATLELGPTERLSSIALVKRLFPILKSDHLENALGFVPGSSEKRETRYWPSLAGMAAVPWLTAAFKADRAAALDYVGQIKRAERTEDGDYASALSRAESSSPIDRVNALQAFGHLDGKLFYDFAIDAAIADTERGWLAENRQDQAEMERKVHQAAKTGLPKLLSALGQAGQALSRGAKPYLALLQMDGDKVGELLGREGPGEDKVSASLADYTDKVKGIVQRHEGVLIYAGGDDVLALFSIDTALPAATELHAAYRDSFQRMAQFDATTSAGLALAHFGVPFSRITDESKRLLEEVAKEQNGRNSIAISVTKQSGRQIEWCTTFEHVARLSAETSGEHSPSEPFLPLVEMFGRKIGDEQRFAGFVYNMRKRYQAYLSADDDQDLTGKLMLAEWLKGENTDRPGFDLNMEIKRLRQLQEVCQTWRYEGDGEKRNALEMDGALLVKFLDDNLIGQSHD